MSTFTLLMLITVLGLSFFAIVPLGIILEKAKRWIDTLPAPLRIPLNAVYWMVIMLGGIYFMEALKVLVALPVFWTLWLLFSR